MHPAPVILVWKQGMREGVLACVGVLLCEKEANSEAEMPMEKMALSQAEQAVRVWQMLVLAARNQQLLSYARVASFTGIAQQGLTEALELIHTYCRKNNYPLLNCLVVSRETGLPGEEFPEKMDRVAMKVEQAKVFDFDWARREKPEAYDFSLK